MQKISLVLSRWGKVLETQKDWTEALQIYMRVLAIDIEHNQELVPSRIKALGRIFKVIGKSKFEAVWRELTGKNCPEELRSAIQSASEKDEE